MEENKFTPLAGRTSPTARDAVTGSVLIVIIINIVILLFVQVAVIFMRELLPALFWTFVALLIAADVALCPIIFRLALREARANASAPPYTVAVQGNELILFYADGSEERFNADRIIAVKARPVHFGFMLAGLVSTGKHGYGTLVFKLSDGGGRRKVRYVAGCKRAAEFIRRSIIQRGG